MPAPPSVSSASANRVRAPQSTLIGDRHKAAGAGARLGREATVRLVGTLTFGTRQKRHCCLKANAAITSAFKDLIPTAAAAEGEV